MAGTIFDRTRTPLTVWFMACWLFATQKDGISAMSLQRALEIGSYQTAWAMLHRLRAVLVRPVRERLRGEVEVDETYIGGERVPLQSSPLAQPRPGLLPRARTRRGSRPRPLPRADRHTQIGPQTPPHARNPPPSAEP